MNILNDYYNPKLIRDESLDNKFFYSKNGIYQSEKDQERDLKRRNYLKLYYAKNRDKALDNAKEKYKKRCKNENQ